MTEWLDSLGNVGFPIVITFYLLFRIEKKLDSVVQQLTNGK
ncbi:MAG: YvrJ family protein [Bacilli bacterium]